MRARSPHQENRSDKERRPTVALVIAAGTGSPGWDAATAPFVAAADASLEVIIVAATSEQTVELGPLPVVARPAGTLVPQLWAVGIERTTAPIFSLTIAECRPTVEWLLAGADLLERLGDGYAGAGGSISPPRRGRLSDWAIYFCRYNAFLPPIPERDAIDVAGDNAFYRRSDLDRVRDPREAGFWEVVVDRQLAEQGKKIRLTSELDLTFEGGASLGTLLSARFSHGRHFGRTRRLGSLVEAFLRAITAPLIIPLVAIRIGKRVAGRAPSLIPRYLICLPLIALILSAWSAGEALGYLARLLPWRERGLTDDGVSAKR